MIPCTMPSENLFVIIYGTTLYVKLVHFVRNIKCIMLGPAYYIAWAKK